MIEGTFILNLDPAFIEFHMDGKERIRKQCSIDELRKILIEMDALTQHQNWPPREYILRLRCGFSKETLANLGLVEFAA